MMCVSRGRHWLVLAVLAFLMLPAVGAAAPIVERTTPLDGEILERTPTAVGVGFDQPIDPAASTFTILTTAGSELPGITTTYAATGMAVTIGLPTSLPDGVYTIVWHAVSAEDSSATDGWSSFGVGNAEDAAIVTIPSDSDSGDTSIPWFATVARWLTLLGLALCTSLWPIWRGMLRPVLADHRASARAVVWRLQSFAWVAIALALIGSLLDLLAHSGLATFPDSVFTTLAHTDWGFWWLVRMLLLVLLGAALALSPWWRRNTTRISHASLWIVSCALPFPLVLSGHAVADDVGRITTVVTSYLLLLAVFLLAGGGSWLAIALRVAPNLPIATRVRWLVLTSAGVIILAGSYLASVYVGNGEALAHTTFGHMVIVALAITAWLGVVALTHRAGFATLAVLGALVLLPLAGMQVSPTARAQLTNASIQLREPLQFDGRAGTLLIAPGATGVNHLRLELSGQYLATDTEVYLDLSSADHPELGQKRVQMYRVQGNAWEHHGTEFSIDGSWQITVLLEEPGQDVATASTGHTFATGRSGSVPAPAWKFQDASGLAGIALASIGIFGAATAITAGGPLRKEAGGLACVALLLAAVVIVQGRIDPALVVEPGEGAIDPNDELMVQRGADLYATYCASCHGAGLRGDGPLAASLNPPPSDFQQPHTRVHSDADLLYWLRYGIQGTAMPGFRSQLSDQDMRDILAFIQNWQQNPDAAANATPELGVCEVQPLEFSALPEVFHHGLHAETRRGTPLVRAAEWQVTPAQTNEVMWTLEQLVNCANQDAFMSQIRLFTPAMLQDIYPQGASWEVTSRATSPGTPVAAADAIAIEDVQSMVVLADGRIAVTVIFRDPAGVGAIPGADPVLQVTFVLVQIDGAWLIDEVR